MDRPTRETGLKLWTGFKWLTQDRVLLRML